MYIIAIEGPHDEANLTEDESVAVDVEPLFKGLDALVASEDADPREEAIAKIYDWWNAHRSQFYF